MHKISLTLLTICLLHTSVLAQSTISDFLSAPFPSNLVGCKDGNKIAWVFNNKGARNIYQADSDGSNVLKLTNYIGDEGLDLGDIQMTSTGNHMVFVRGNGANARGEAANPAFLQIPAESTIYSLKIGGDISRKISSGSSPRISPDGNFIAYLSGRQIWLTSLNDTMVKPEKLFQSRGNQSDIQWSPDGKSICFVSDRGDHAFVGIYEIIAKKVKFLETSIDNDVNPVWSPDGKKLAYLRIPNMHNLLPFTPVRTTNPWSIRVYDFQEEKAMEVWKADAGKGSALYTDLPSGNSLLWWGAANQLIFPWEKDGWIHLYALDQGSKVPKLLTPGDGEIENVTLSKDLQSIIYTSNIGDIDRRHINKVNITTGAIEKLTSGKEIEYSPVPTSQGLAYLYTTAKRPAWPAIMINGQSKDIASDLFPQSFPTNLVEPTATTITAIDGIKTTADVFLPVNYDAAKKYPAVIFLHGGSRRQMLLGFHYSQYYANAYAMNQYFASKGYIVLSLNYRSGIGYGINFREALNYGAGGASEVNDLIAAGKYLQKRTDVNSNKIALYGGSYGGYLTAHGLSQAPNIFATGVDIHGVHNWNDEIPTFAPWYDYSKFPAMAAKALASSPISHIKNWKAPVLMIHGDDDRNVPFSESVNFAEQLRKQNVQVEQLVFPDEVHFFLLHQNWVKAYEATFEFINRQLNIVQK